MDRLRPDRRTAVVTLAHDPKLDDPALDRALKFARVLHRRARFPPHARQAAGSAAQLGHTDDVLARIRGPVGLNMRGGDRARKSRSPSSPRSSPCAAVRCCRRRRRSRMKFGPGPAGRSRVRASWPKPARRRNRWFVRDRCWTTTRSPPCATAGRSEVHLRPPGTRRRARGHRRRSPRHTRWSHRRSHDRAPPPAG